MGFRYPTGARPLLVEETARRRRIEARFVSVLEAAGFAEIVLPIIDFADPYAALTDGRANRHSYRFVDREGEIVTIRSDFTPMVARALAPAIEPSQFPLKVFYRGDVIRCETTRLGANREMFQIGAELIGDPSPEADREILELVGRIAGELIADATVVYTGVGRASRPQAAAVPAGAAPPSETLGGSGRDARPPRFVEHDESDEPSSYYTGLRFWVYGNGRRTPFAQGGRYDSLYGRFGTEAPAVGFTFTIDDLED
jgi:ATP phosphoribosyltransferase regulatory subunit HisZ